VATTKTKLEIEVKLACDSLDGFRRLGLDLQLAEPRHFEDNWLLDSVTQNLFEKGSALRIRVVEGQGLLTYKGIASDSARSILKIREEIESPVEEPERIIEIFERLGFYRSFRYQKYRTTYAVTWSGRRLTITFDETPLGNFIEIEGDEMSVLDVMQQAGFSATDIIRESYPELQARRCAERGLPLEDLIF
jgi:adenylate cyclase, class 2